MKLFHNLNFIVEQALDTLQLSTERFQKILLTKFDLTFDFSQCSDLKNESAISVLIIFEALYLHDVNLYMNYDEEMHLRTICTAIEKRKFIYQRRKNINTAWKEFKKERWIYENHRYGLRLRWNIRINHFFPWIKLRIPAWDEFTFRIKPLEIKFPRLRNINSEY